MKPLSYDSSKCVIQYLPIEARLNIRLRCPRLRTADSVVPLRIHTFQMDSYSLRLDHIEYRLIFPLGIDDGSNQIDYINHESLFTSTVNLGMFRDVDARRSFLMDKFFSGRRCPVVIEQLELKQDTYHSFGMVRDLFFPKDFEMKLKYLEMYHPNEQVIQQFSSHITGDPLKMFKTRFIFDNPVANSSLIQNARKLDIPIDTVTSFFNGLLSFPQKAIILNNGLRGHSIYDLNQTVTLILARQNSNLATGTNIIIITSERFKNVVVNRLWQQHGAQESVVKINQTNIPCVTLPMDQDKELNVYGMPGARASTILKIKVMPRRSAK